MRLAYFLSAALLAATAVAQASTSDKDLTPTDVLAQLPDFPKHWNQAHLYNQVIRDEYGNGAPAGCVAVAGAACMDWFHYPAQFGEKEYNATGRELRTEPLDWARLAPEPLDARGRRTAQTILYNLGLLTQIHYVQGGSSTTPLVYLAAALKDPSVNYASAYYVEFGSGATDKDVETAIWASLRCGSPVAMSVERDGGAHAVVATGCGTDANGNPLTQVFGGYGSAPTWMDVPTSMPVPGGYTYSRLASVVTGIVPTAPEGISSGAALPVLGTVVDKNGRPIPFAKVSLSINGAQVAETATDLQGRYGLWGWFGYDMTIQASIYTSSTQTVSSDPNTTLPAQRHNGTTDYPLPGMPALRIPVANLCNAIEACERTLIINKDLSDSAIIHTDLKAAKDAATASSNQILCLNSEDPDLKAAFRRFDDYTLLYADPRLPAPFPEVDSLPDATAFTLDTTGAVTAYTAVDKRKDLYNFIDNPKNQPITTVKSNTKFTISQNGRDIKIADRISEGIIATVEGDVRFGTFTVHSAVTLQGEGSLTWGDLVQYDSITFDGPNLRYIPPEVDEGEDGKKIGETSAFPDEITVRNGAELYFGEGDVSGYGYTETDDNPITIGPGGILCVVARDTLARRLILDGGHIDLGNRDTSGDYGFGSLDLLHTIVEVKGNSSVSALSGVGNAALCIRGSGNKVVTEFQFSNGARLDCPVLVAKPANTGDQGRLRLTGNGVAAFGTVEAPTMASDGVLLEGGTFTGGLTLESGARLTTRAPITVTGDFSASGTITIEGDFSGLIVKGVTKIPEGVTFTTPENFSVVAAEDGLRLVADSATDPVWYADGVRVGTNKPKGATADNSLLVLTTTDRKESGLWEDYAAFRSSPAGGGWNVCIAADGNITEGTAAEYIGSMDCDYVLIGASAAEIPALAGTIDRLANFHIGRLPLRESIQMGTIVDLSSAGSGSSQVKQPVSDYASLQGYVDKLTRAGTNHAQGSVILMGRNFGEQKTYDNTTTNYGFPEWTFNYTMQSRGTTLYALCERYTHFTEVNSSALPSVLLYSDAAVPVEGKAPDRPDVYNANATLLWAEEGVRPDLGIIAAGGGSGRITAEAIPGLYTLAIAPIGKSGTLSQKEDSPSVGEMLVLNPQGGALAAILPTGSYTPTIGTDGIPSGAEHTLCGTVAEELIANPDLTVGQAFNKAFTANPNLSSTLTLLGDPTVRIAPFIIPTEWTGEAGDSLWETAGNWRSGQAPTASDTVTVTLADGDHASILLPEDASATTLNIVGPESGSATLLLTGTTTDTSTGAAIGDLALTDKLALSGNATVEAAIPIAPSAVSIGAGATLRTTAALDFTGDGVGNNYWNVSGDGTLDVAHLRPKFANLPKTLRLTARTAGTVTFSTQTLTTQPEGFSVDAVDAAGDAWETSWAFANDTLTVTLKEAAEQPEPNPILPEGEEGVQFSEETLQALRDAARDGGISGDFHVAAQSVDGTTTRPIAELDDALACFEGLEPTVENGKVVVAYDFGVTRLHIEGDTVFVTLSVRGKGQPLTFTEGNAYAIAPQSLDGSQPLAAPETVTDTPNEDGTVTLSFPLPEGDSTFLFRATVSRPTP